MDPRTGLILLLCSSALANVPLDPRGTRPVHHGHKADKCDTQKEWAFCSDEDWGPKCPSGCRVLGLMDKHDHEILTKINRIRTLLEQNQAKHGSTDRLTKQTYDYLKERLTSTSGSDFNYQEMSQKLRRRIVDTKIKIDNQLRIMSTMKDTIKRQVSEMQRLEVDIDMKLRACKGSCKTYTKFSVDQASYVTLDKQMAELESEASPSAVLSRTIHVMKARVLKEQLVTSVFKSNLGPAPTSGPAPFQEVSSINLILTEEGSTSSSPVTVSKDQGTSSFSSGGAVVGDQGTKSITELSPHWGGGIDFDSFPASEVVSKTSHTTTTSCTKRIKTTVTNTPSGPVETREEVMEGGPGCQSMMDSSKGGMSSIFPTLDRTKGNPLDTKTGFADTGFDLAAFTVGDPEDDLPDIHARSLKSTSGTKTLDFVGKGTGGSLE